MTSYKTLVNTNSYLLSNNARSKHENITPFSLTISMFCGSVAYLPVMYSVVTPAILCVGHCNQNTLPSNTPRNAAIIFILIMPLHLSFLFFTMNPPNNIPPPAPGTVIIPVSDS